MSVRKTRSTKMEEKIETGGEREAEVDDEFEEAQEELGEHEREVGQDKNEENVSVGKQPLTMNETSKAGGNERTESEVFICNICQEEAEHDAIECEGCDRWPECRVWPFIPTLSV